MPSLLVAHHRPGFYLRVLEEGAVQAGDEIVKVADGPERLTVAQIDGLLYLPNQVARAAANGRLRVPALSEGWKGSFRELLAKADGGRHPRPPGRASSRCASRRSAGERDHHVVPARRPPTARREREPRSQASTSPSACNRDPISPR